LSAQNAAGAPQSVAARHPTHSPFAGSHTGEPPPQLAFDVQPMKHLRSALQVGAVTGQSALPRHCTHRPWPVAQTGAAAPQFAFVRHATHCLVVGLQSGLSVPAQSVSAVHPTHWPLGMSHWVPFGQDAWGHAPWQEWSLGQHAGAAVGQSVFAAHVWQAPSTHRGLAVGHAESAVHSTQPSDASHTFGAVHPDLQSPPPPFGPAVSPWSPDEPPPHAENNEPPRRASATTVRAVKGRICQYYRPERASGKGRYDATMAPRVRLIEALGVLPLAKTVREIELAAFGDGRTPKSRFGLSSLRQFRPRYGVTLWLGGKPERRLVPLTNLYNYRQPPPELGWSVKVTDVRDFRGGANTYDSHNGTDFAIPPGTRVVACAPGRVLRVSSEFHRGGRKIFLDHGRGLVTTYNHLARPLVRPGQTVARGETIALSGYSGIDALVGFPWTPPHVHLNTWLNGVYVDPFTPIDQVDPSLWRRRNAPVPAAPADLGDTDHEPTRWDEEALATLVDACEHPATRDEIRLAPTLGERIGAALMHKNYFPTRFDRRRLGDDFCLHRDRYPREPRLDLPFSSEDYDGVYFPER
jgi:murein DD-endopeptidase